MNGVKHIIIFCDAVDQKYNHSFPNALLWPNFIQWKKKFSKWLRFV